MDDKYFWTHDGGVKLDDWLKKTRPSIITDDETPWIWVQGTKNDKIDPERETNETGALAKAKDILSRLETRMEEIQKDDSIPVRKKGGQKGKADMKKEAQATAAEELKQLSLEVKWTTGKWMFFPKHEGVDSMWAELARSVAHGPLKDAGVDLAKVAPSPEVQGSFVPPHLICLYLDNVYDKDAVRKVLEVLLTQHGLEPSACKSDLYTLVGIDSKHPSGLRSTVWRPVEVIEGGAEAIKKMKDKHRTKKISASAGGESKPPVGADGLIESDEEDDKVVQAAKRKPASPARAEDESSKAEKKRAPPPVKRARTEAMRYQDEDIFAGAEAGDSD